MAPLACVVALRSSLPSPSSIPIAGHIGEGREGLTASDLAEERSGGERGVATGSNCQLQRDVKGEGHWIWVRRGGGGEG